MLGLGFGPTGRQNILGALAWPALANSLRPRRSYCGLSALAPQGFFDVPVKIGFKPAVLHQPVFFKLTFGKRLRHFLTHLAGMIQNFPLLEF